MNKRKKILLAQRACVENYPPTLNQAALLQEVADVVLLDSVTSQDPFDVLTNDDIQRVRICKAETSAQTYKKVLARLKWRWQFSKELRSRIRLQPDVVIAYDPEAACLMLGMKKKSVVKHIVHLHEMLIDDPNADFISRRIVGSLQKRLHRAELVVVPDLHRAKHVKEVAGLKSMPLVVMNCPLRMEALPESRLLPFLARKGFTSNRIVHYQGSIGNGHGLENIILSMIHWPEDALFVIVGRANPDYLEKLKKIAQEVGVLERVVFVGRVPYNEVLSYAMGATIGVTLLKADYPNWKWSAGASNKRFEYLALGIPQVTNDAPGIKELFEDTGVAVRADYNDSDDIGRKICLYLNNDRLCRNVGDKARALHLNKYNYEHQFRPVLEWIE